MKKEIDIKLEKLKFVAIERLSREFIDATVDFSLHESFLIDEICMRIKTFVWAEEESAKYQEIKYPSDWKEAFKERWFPKRLLKKYPVKYNLTIIDVKAIYPTLKVKIPDHQRILNIRRLDSIRSSKKAQW